MILFDNYIDHWSESVPRVGGGDPPQIEFILDKVKCSPRRRG